MENDEGTKSTASLLWRHHGHSSSSQFNGGGLDGAGGPTANSPQGHPSSPSSVKISVKRYRDAIWQSSPPRLLRYRTSHLHAYGYIPFLWRNVRATVFANFYIHAQTIVLCLWAGLIHATGFGIPDNLLVPFVTFFGSNYGGSTFNVLVVVVFLLGLFTSLVVTRWWSVRSEHSKVVSASIEAASTAALQIRDPGAGNLRSRKPKPPQATGTPWPAPAAGPGAAATLKSPAKSGPTSTSELDREPPGPGRHALSQLIRMLNLGHLMVLLQADNQSRLFLPSRGLLSAWRSLTKAVSRAGKSNKVQDREAWSKELRDLSFPDLVQHGLVTEAEWDAICRADESGMPRWMLPYHWAQAIAQSCAERGLASPSGAAAVSSRVSMAVQAASTLHTFLGAQLPYPYVHLVSLTVHVYLFILATWLGAMLHTGYGGDTYTIDMETVGPTGATGEVAGTMVRSGRELRNNPLLCTVAYLLLAFANAVMQGLLDLHSLVDNPFGKHPAKFPLRAQITDLLAATSAFVTHGGELPPGLMQESEGLGLSTGAEPPWGGPGAGASGSPQGRPRSEVEMSSSWTRLPHYEPDPLGSSPGQGLAVDQALDDMNLAAGLGTATV